MLLTTGFRGEPTSLLWRRTGPAAKAAEAHANKAARTRGFTSEV